MQQIRFLLLFLLAPILLLSREGPEDLIPSRTPIPYDPWFTGPLLAPTPVNMKPGHPAIEPSITFFCTYGIYDSSWKLEKQDNTWSINPLVDFQFGITDNTGIEIIASTITNIKEGKNSTHFQDTLILFGYQVSNDQKDSWVPDCRIFLQELFPSGKYDRLDPNKQGLDLTGEGSYQTGPAIAFRKLFYLTNHFFSLRWSVSYLFPSKVKVHGFNAYGGGFNTSGKIRPGQTLIAFLSGEYSINQHWVFAFDTEFFYQRKSSSFSGNPGTVATGEVAQIGLPSSTQISFAPEIEYNFNPSSGLIFGAWFTIAGKNSSAFAAIFFTYLYIF